MIDPKSIEASLEFYEKTKAYFVEKETLNCVIEISDGPFEKWVRHYPNSVEEMSSKRLDLAIEKKRFIAIGVEDNLRCFFFSDRIISKGEVLDTGEIVCFDIEQLYEINREQIRKEFLALKKLLQGA